jgi:phosphoribosylaminoimidazolecarboxamide formyltransferase/IMP cyclohydrolase
MSQEQTVVVRRALISVSDKTGLVERARRLVALGVELISTGGTARSLKAEGLPVRDVSELTGFPEMMDGRVKTLHPVVHGGLLFRRDLPEHVKSAADHGIEPIDLVWINLYPFEETVRSGADEDECIENIDIGGPAMLRAAAKNAAFVAVCTDNDDVDAALEELEAGSGVSLRLRRRLAAKTYARTGAYDAAISEWYWRALGEDAGDWRCFGGRLQQSLRYGENPHQKASVYAGPDQRPGVLSARQVQGKELSYNNINDTDAAFELVSEFDPAVRPAVAIIKHANPCGVALGGTALEAYRSALACDPVSAFGGIVALNTPLDRVTAEAITEIFTEVVIAPGADEEALRVFSRKKNLRLLLTSGLADPAQPGVSVRTVAGGLLVQDRDTGRIAKEQLRIVTRRQPTASELRDMLFAWTVAKHVKSNAIVYARDGVTAGIGPGQTSRLDSTRVAARKAIDAKEAAGWEEVRTKGCACASDAFFPFPDGLLQAAEAGATCVIQPGGSVKDADVIAAADEAGLAMAFTGMRHFRH